MKRLALWLAEGPGTGWAAQAAQINPCFFGISVTARGPRSTCDSPPFPTAPNAGSCLDSGGRPCWRTQVWVKLMEKKVID
ncbi:hypothetical protein DM02DRAFT_617450 [Periconia macrospinosa]|uniref:Uncharacterized protein n=1 Tax=Periconia macrospinosa TaxID=97972 RepID=A0A2V1DDE4_9PLEO|nr:hypothetical protein DM02DRAFT_617450 [Periconia macrospinosa]